MILDTYSKRLKRQQGKTADVFSYHDIPIGLRIQIVKIWRDCIGESQVSYRGENPAFVNLQQAIATEFGMFRLGLESTDSDSLIIYFVNKATTEQALDMIDVVFTHVAKRQGAWPWARDFGVKQDVSEGINDLNVRFLEHGIGYSFVDGDSPQLVRIDNEHLHKEVVLPALSLLHDKAFKGADEEYRLAHEHYRHGRYKECLNDCLKAFESTMKTICAEKNWTFKTTDTASVLVKLCLEKGLLPPYMDSHLGTVQSALTSAIPTLRNKNSAHGQGSTPTEVPRYYAEYLLHETATSIVFLVEAYKALP